MFQDLGFETLTPQAAALYFGLGFGLLFGALAQISRFCLRRALVGSDTDRAEARGVWAMAFVTALLGTQSIVAAGWVDFGDHRLMAANLPYAAIIVGGLAFGGGMVLTRGCISRLTVLLAGGNLRALIVLLVFGITAHATLKGVLAPLRVWLGGFSANLDGAQTLAALPGGAWTGAAILAAIGLIIVWRSTTRPLGLILGAAIGALVPLGWAVTGYVLFDDFDPIPIESLSFTLPFADTLFWTIASSSIHAGFNVGLVGGVVLGAFLATMARGEFKWASFDSPALTRRYVLGGIMMGLGGVLAGGCTLGAGLSGVSTLSVAALLALVSIIAGARIMRVVLHHGATADTAPLPA